MAEKEKTVEELLDIVIHPENCLCEGCVFLRQRLGICRQKLLAKIDNSELPPDSIWTGLNKTKIDPEEPLSEEAQRLVDDFRECEQNIDPTIIINTRR